MFRLSHTFSLFYRLYEKTTLMSKTFQYWCFNFTKGSLPDFVLENKPFFIKSSLDYSNEDSYLINRFAHRISRLEINTTHMLMLNLRNMKMTEFPCLHTLDLKSVSFDNQSLIMMSPQLEILKLSCIKTKFDLDSIKEDDKSFTKLKVLKIVDCNIDGNKILSKCCKTLKHLELGHKQLKHLKGLEQLSSIKFIEISITNIPQQSKVRHLLSKASASLRTLVLHDKSYDKADLSMLLLAQTMAITSIKIESNTRKLSKFLNECPQIQKLTLIGHERDVDQVLLKDLINIRFEQCSARSVSSFLKQVYRSPLKNLEIIKPENELTNYELSKFFFVSFSKLENVLVDWGNVDHYSKTMDQVIKLFPENAQVVIFVLYYLIKFHNDYARKVNRRPFGKNMFPSNE